MAISNIKDIDIVIPNLHWHYSGVTATNRMIAPEIAKDFNVFWLGPDRPGGISKITFLSLFMLWRHSKPIIWHARRNTEMIIGIVLRTLGWPFILVFTSAAQRHHTWITRWLVARMETVIATSEISAGFLKRTSIVIPHGIDTNLYRPPLAHEHIALVEVFQVPNLIGCFGRVRAQKGTDLFVTAMCELLPRYPNWGAVIIGAITPDQDLFAQKLRDQILSAGLADRVKLLGELDVEELPLWYRKLNIYAFTSRIEGFGLTLLEAMSSGTALVASRAGASEILVRDGETGILVPTGESSALKKGIEQLICDEKLRKLISTRAREYVCKNFSISGEAKRIGDVYKGLLKNYPSSR